MKKILTVLLVALAPLAFVACDNDDDYYRGPGWAGGGGSPSGELNSYERALVGRYVSDDDPSSVYRVVLNSDRTGSYSVTEAGQTYGDTFVWGADSRTLTFVYDSDGVREDNAYSFSNSHLYIGKVPLVADTGQEPQQPATPLVGQWQGLIKEFYSTVYGLGDDSCETVMEFASDGTGAQLDYDTYAPKDNYAYTPFTWSQAEGVIAVNYVENGNAWMTRAIFTNYALTTTRFTGSASYGEKWFKFAFEDTEGFDWTPYISGTGVASAKTRLSALRRAGSGPVRKGTFAR